MNFTMPIYNFCFVLVVKQVASLRKQLHKACYSTVVTPMSYKEWAKKEEEELLAKRRMKEMLDRGLDGDSFFSLDGLFDGLQEDNSTDGPMAVVAAKPKAKTKRTRGRSSSVLGKENKPKKPRSSKPPPSTNQVSRTTRSGRLRKFPSKLYL